MRMTGSTQTRPARPVRGPLPVAGGVLLGGVALSAVYRLTGMGLPCPLRLLTGWECPLCGGTRMGASLLQGDLAAAWAYNPALLVLLLLGVVLVPLWLLARRRRPGLTAPRPVPWLRSLPDAVTSTAVVAALLGWTLLRNLS